MNPHHVRLQLHQCVFVLGVSKKKWVWKHIITPNKGNIYPVYSGDPAKKSCHSLGKGLNMLHQSSSHFQKVCVQKAGWICVQKAGDTIDGRNPAFTS